MYLVHHQTAVLEVFVSFAGAHENDVTGTLYPQFVGETFVVRCTHFGPALKKG